VRLPWPWRRRPRAKLSKLTLPYVSAERVKRGHWRIEMSSPVPGCEPIVYDFWGTDAQVRERIEWEFNARRQYDARRRRAAERRRKIETVHREGRHLTGSIKDCPRCAPLIQGEGQVWLKGRTAGEGWT
jgi:hypothetical protein